MGRPLRKNTKRDFFNPSGKNQVNSVTSTVTLKSAKSWKSTFEKTVFTKYTPKASHPTNPSKKDGTDPYKKDDTDHYCPIKLSLNAHLVYLCQTGYSCLVLDGQKARSTKALLKAGASRVVIANNSWETYKQLFTHFKNDERVTVISACSTTFVLKTNETFDLVYLDGNQCYTSLKGGVKREVQNILEKGTLKDGGVLAVTWCRRGTPNTEEKMTHLIKKMRPTLRHFHTESYEKSMITSIYN